MKIIFIIVRTLLGLQFLFSSVVVLFNLMPNPPVMTGNVKIFMEGVAASGYLLTLIKVTEFICALALITGLFARLATVVIFPVTLNIFMYHASISREFLPVASLMLAANLFIAWYYRKSYAPMFQVR